MERSQLFWQTYLNLEKEMLEIAKYIYITDEITTYAGGKLITSHCETQLDTFSPHIADLLIKTCVEIEAISKELYYSLGGEKTRGDKTLFFDEDCLKLIDKKCRTHQKVVMISSSSFNLTKEENLCFKPLREAHKRQGTDWERAYQALKHDRYTSINKGTVKNLIHAMGALYLLNVYCRDIKFFSKFLEVNNLDFSLGSSVFSVAKPHQEYLIDIINNQKINCTLASKESPFVLKYTDECYKKILEANKAEDENIRKYIFSQPELYEQEFIQQLSHSAEQAKKEGHTPMSIFCELCIYRINKKLPSTLPFNERKELFISSPEWNGKTRMQNNHLKESELTAENIQFEIDLAGKLAGFELQKKFYTPKIVKSVNEGYCELVLDKGNVKYSRD